MSIVNVKRAFIEGLAGKAALVGAAMKYVPNEHGENCNQELAFAVSLPDGTAQMVVEVVPPRTDLVTKARAMGEALAASLAGG